MVTMTTDGDRPSDHMSEPHVTATTRTVYRGTRAARDKWKLTRHAAYVAVAKGMIAARCKAMNDVITESWLAQCDAAEVWVEGPHTCGAELNGKVAYRCRYHTVYEWRAPDDPVGGGMEYYAKVRDRLTRFLKFVDANRGKASETRTTTSEYCHQCMTPEGARGCPHKVVHGDDGESAATERANKRRSTTSGSEGMW